MTVEISKIKDFYHGDSAQYIRLHGLQDALDVAANIVNNHNAFCGDLLNSGRALDSYRNFVGLEYNDVIKTNNVVANADININDFSYACEEKSNDWNDIEKDYKYDVAGLSYDMGEYLSGTPEYWLTSMESEIKPLIKLYASIGTYFYVSNKSICKRAQKQLSILLYFLKNNYPVELHTITLTKKRRKYYVIDNNFGLYNDLPFLDFLYSFATSVYYRGLMLEVMQKYYLQSYRVPHVNTRDFYNYMLKQANYDSCNIVLSSECEDYTNDSKIKDFLDNNDFESGKTYFFGSGY